MRQRAPTRKPERYRSKSNEQTSDCGRSCPAVPIQNHAICDAPEEAIEYIVEGLLPSSGSSALIGKPKSGKTTFSRQLAVAVAQGGEFLGRSTVQGAVLLLAIEEKESEVRRHLNELGMCRTDPIFLRCGAVPDKHVAVAQLEASLKANPDVKIVIIDTLFRFLSCRDSSDYIMVNDVMEHLGELARSTGAHILTVHHMKKKETDDPLDAALGSTAITGGVDSILVLWADGAGVRKLCTRQRYGIDMPQTQLCWSPATRELSLGASCAEVSRLAAGENSRRIEGEIIQYVAVNPNCSQDDVCNAVAGKRTLKLQIIQQLCGDMFVQLGAGKKGDPHTYTTRTIPAMA